MFTLKKTGIADACRLAGSQRALAIVLDVSDTAISTWVTQGYVPLGRAHEIEVTFGICRTKLLNPKLLAGATPRMVPRVSLPLDLEL